MLVLKQRAQLCPYKSQHLLQQQFQYCDTLQRTPPNCVLDVLVVATFNWSYTLRQFACFVLEVTSTPASQHSNISHSQSGN